MNKITPPKGFVLDDPSTSGGSVPPPPDGFELEGGQSKAAGTVAAPPPPEGFDLESPAAPTRTVPPSGAPVPVPRERPALAPTVGAFAETKPTEELPPVQGLDIKPGETRGPTTPLQADTIQTVGEIKDSTVRGYHGFQQGVDALGLGANARPLINLTEVENRIAKGETDQIVDKDDLFGARFMTPEQRADLRKELEGNVKSTATRIAERQGKIDAIPTTPEMEEFGKSKTWEEFFDNFMKSPKKIIAHTIAGSAANMVPSLGAGIVGGVAAGPVGFMAGVGAGSYGTDYVATVLDAMRDEKINLNDPAAVEAAVSNKEFMERIGKKAHAHAVGVGLLDAASGRLAGASLLPKSIRPQNKILEKLAEAPIQIPAEGALGGAGEALGETLAGDPLNPVQIGSEIIGEMGGAPATVASAVGSTYMHGRRAVEGLVRPDGVTITPEQIEAQVAAGNVPGVTVPQGAVSNPTVPQPPPAGVTPPPPVTAPVDVEDGVTTVTKSDLGRGTNDEGNNPPLFAHEDSKIPTRAAEGQIQDYRFQTEDVPISWLRQLVGNDLRHDVPEMMQLAADIEANGINSPGIITVGKNSGTAKLGEGNHRLAVLEQLGYTHMPVRVIVGSNYGSEKGAAANVKADLIPEEGQYFKADAKPSEVFRSLSESNDTYESVPKMPGEAVPAEGFYSKLRSWVQERGPYRATAQRWKSIIGKGDFRSEEVRDMKLDQYLASVGPKERLTRDDILSHLDQNAITLQEIERRPMTEVMRSRLNSEIQGRLGDILRTDPTASDGRGHVNREHPGVRELDNALQRLNDTKNWTKYEQYTTPGPREAYVELTLSTPNRTSTDTSIVEPKGQVVYDPEGDSRYPWQILTEGREWNRTKTEESAHAELQEHLDITRNLRLASTKREFKGGHYQVPGEVVTIRVTIRRTIDGQPYALLEEAQGDIHQKGEKIGYGVGTPGMHGVVPHLPFKEGWGDLAFNRFLMWAAEKGIRHVAWADAAEQMRRYPAESDEEYRARYNGMHAFYGRELLGAAKRWKKRVGATLGYETVVGPNYEVRPLDNPNTSGWQSTGSIGAWGVFDLNRDNSNPLAVTMSQEEGEAYVERNTSEPVRFRMLEIPQTGLEYINAGMPTHAKEVEDPSPTMTVQMASNVPVMEAQAVQPLVRALEELIRQLKLGINVNIQIFKDKLTSTEKWKSGAKAGQLYQKTQPTYAGLMEGRWNATKTEYSKAEIKIALGHHKTAHNVWTTMLHELGHVIEKTSFAKAPLAVRQATIAAHQEYLAKFPPGTTVGQVTRQRANPIDIVTGVYNPDSATLLSALTPGSRAYQTNFAEWFAEQVVKWGTSRQKPLSVVEKFFSGLGKKIVTLFNEGMKKFNLPVNAQTELHNWLDSQIEGHPEFFGAVVMETNNAGTVGNSTQMGPEEPPAPPQVETQSGMNGVNGVFNGNPPPIVHQTRAYADKFNWLYKWTMSIVHVATRNPHIASLAEYVETLSVASMLKNQVMIRAQEVLEGWNRLGEKQADAVAAMLDDVQHMTYRTPAEIAAKVARHPTLAELQSIASRYGVSQKGFAVFIDVAKSFQEHLDRVEKMLRLEADKITDQTKNGLAHARIDKQMLAYRSKPYFPSMRFGDYTITIRNAAGQVTHFETFESKRDRDRAAGVMEHNGVPRINGPKREGMQLGVLDKQARPLLGVPTQLLELMGEKLKMSDLQRDALEQLKFELSPAQSFQHRFQHKRQVAGYSMDFRRAYATYFFHGANHLAKAMYSDRLRELTKITKDEAWNQFDVDKRDKIVAYMTDHTQEWLDPKSDWAAVRSVAFLWHLSFSAATAAANLTQTLTTSYPFLASKFNDAKAVAALANAGRKLQTFYRKGSLQNTPQRPTSFEENAIWLGMEYGIIKETQAPELAGYADGDLLSKKFGGNTIQRGFVRFNEAGAFMFEMAEQMNRRLVFRAALQLALENPNSKYVRDMIKKHGLMYDQVRATMTEEQAAAFVTAVDATKETQFQYGREYAPRIFRGKLRTVFVFKTFMLNYVMFLSNYPKAMIRSLLIVGFLGGFMGVPGSDDLRQLLQALAWQLLGKDFDLEQEARRWIIQMLGNDENGREWAELIMHGSARKGFGIPHLMDMLGGTVGYDIPFPTLDRSAAISGGTLLPVELGKIFGPPVNEPATVIAGQTQKASGAMFGLGFAVYKSLVNHKVDWDDAKRWEGMVPKFLANISKARRAWTEGGERRADGSQLVEYDVRDPQQMAEVFGIAAGYRPYRQTLQVERDLARHDASKLWEVRRQDLMRQFGSAALGKTQSEMDEVRDAIIKFNTSLPDEARSQAITNDALKQSVEARARGRAYNEAEISQKKNNVPVEQNVLELYPESQRVMRKVKRGLAP